MQVVNLQLLGAVGMDADTTSNGVLLDQVYGYSVHAIVSGGTAAGTLQLQASNDNVTAQNLVTNWVNVGSSINANANSMTNVDGVHYKWVRVKFTKSTGANTDLLTVNYYSKGP